MNIYVLAVSHFRQSNKRRSLPIIQIYMIKYHRQPG
jgi:hypothetical protein